MEIGGTLLRITAVATLSGAFIVCQAMAQASMANNRLTPQERRRR